MNFPVAYPRKLAKMSVCDIFAEYTMEFPDRVTINSHIIKIRPRYCESDQGGVVHHSVYPVWFEMGRTELLRANGIAYKDLEQAGIYFVMARLEIKYRQPARYDEQLELTTSCTNVTTCKIEHSYQLKRAFDGALLAEGSSTLACLDKEGKVIRMPEFLYSIGAYDLQGQGCEKTVD